MFDMGKFSKKLKTLRGEMSRRKFAETVGIGHESVRSYEYGRSMPNAYVLFNIAKTFNVSVNELLGLNDMGDDEYRGNNDAK